MLQENCSEWARNALIEEHSLLCMKSLIVHWRKLCSGCGWVGSQALFRVREHLLDLGARDIGEPIEEVVDIRSALKILKQRDDGHSSAREQPRATHFPRSAFDGWTCGPLKHGAS